MQGSLPSPLLPWGQRLEEPRGQGGCEGVVLPWASASLMALGLSTVLALALASQRAPRLCARAPGPEGD